MKYTIKVSEVQKEGSSIRGFANVVFGDALKITNIAILENKETGALFVTMPRYKSSGAEQGEHPVYKDICHPTTKEFREKLYGDILKAYHQLKVNGPVPDIKDEEKQDIPIPEFSVLVTAWSQENSNVRGLASIYLEDCFLINNVTILQGKENLFVSMPSYKSKKLDENNQPVYQDICYPVTKEFREKLYTELLTECEKQIKKVEEISKTIEKPLNSRGQMQKEAAKKQTGKSR